jgi:hypothetical protein
MKKTAGSRKTSARNSFRRGFAEVAAMFRIAAKIRPIVGYL